jgi:hypothetical protein
LDSRAQIWNRQGDRHQPIPLIVFNQISPQNRTSTGLHHNPIFVVANPVLEDLGRSIHPHIDAKTGVIKDVLADLRAGAPKNRDAIGPIALEQIAPNQWCALADDRNPIVGIAGKSIVGNVRVTRLNPNPVSPKIGISHGNPSQGCPVGNQNCNILSGRGWT